MTLSPNFLNWIADTISKSYPTIATMIRLAVKYQPQLQQLGPVVAASIKEGPGALAAAEKAAPELTKAIQDLVASNRPAGTPAQHKSMAENTARRIFGFAEMTPHEESDWMNKSTPGNDPSQENSKFPIG